MSPTLPRFHALDALRAFALLLGVVFHAAWFYLQVPYLAPVTDVRANAVAGWFFTTSHAFRMQLFFLIAGFFAHRVFHQRGFRAFARNRLQRIAVPLLLGWQTIVPILIFLYWRGRQMSGQRDALESPLAFLASAYRSGQFLVPAGLGGPFGFVHLWFLYYLLFYYGAILSGRWLILKLVRHHYPLQARADAGMDFLARSFWGPILLALAFAPLLWLMHGWMGVDAPEGFPIPKLSVLLVHGLFFLFGWLLHRVADGLDRYFVFWNWHLGIGIVASVGLYATYYELSVNFLYGLQYPEVTLHDVQDWRVFQAGIAGQALTEPSSTVVRRLWARLPASVRARVTQEAPLTVDERQGMIFALNHVLQTPKALSEDNAGSGAPASRRLKRRDLSTLSNRQILQPYLRGVSAVISPDVDGYRPLKLGYSVCYGMVMCLLIFGCLGAFQAKANNFSPVWRYVADASYWIYLVHLLPLLGIEFFIYRWDITALVKIPLLMGLSSLLLFGSYHYLVRSTWIGRFLNGRSYPFHLNPLRAFQEEPLQGFRQTIPKHCCYDVPRRFPVGD